MSAARTLDHALALLQFGDSMFPVGAFSFSNGLESAVEEGVVHDRSSLAGFVGTAVRQAAGCDAIGVLEGHRGARTEDRERVRLADAAVFTRKLNEEMRTMTVRMGHKLAEASVRIAPSPGTSAWSRDIADGLTPGTYPVGIGVALAGLGLPETDAFAMHQYGVAMTMVGAATRLMRLHHLDAQSIVFEAGRTAPEDYKRVASLTTEDMATFAPATDVLAGIHVDSFVRMFMN